MSIIQVNNSKVLHVTKTTEEWASVTTVIDKGLLCVETTTDGKTKAKIGDGTNTFADLPYLQDGTINIDDIIADINKKPGLLVDETLGNEIFNDLENNSATGEYSHAEGSGTIASGNNAHAEGSGTKAIGTSSHAEGQNGKAFETDESTHNSPTAHGIASHVEGIGTIAGVADDMTVGYAAHAEGAGTTASADHSHAEGYRTVASGKASHAEGELTYATGAYSHAEGNLTQATGDNSHAEGDNTMTHAVDDSGNMVPADCAHAEGYHTAAGGDYSHAEGYETKTYNTANGTTTYGVYAHAEGYKTVASGGASHAEGSSTQATGENSHAEGCMAIASAPGSHAEGYPSGGPGFGGGCQATADGAHAEGGVSLASGKYSHAEGHGSIASGQGAHAEGDWVYYNNTGYRSAASATAAHAEGGGATASAPYTHAEGYLTQARESYAHAEGYMSDARGIASHTEGYQTATGSNTQNGGALFKGDYAHAEGYNTRAIGTAAHAEGYSSQTYLINPGGFAMYDEAAHAEGISTQAAGRASHTEGDSTKTWGYKDGGVVLGYAAHAEGWSSVAQATASHAEGYGTIAASEAQHAGGKYNVRDEADKFAFIIGNGSGDEDADRSNAFAIDWDGKIYVNNAETGIDITSINSKVDASLIGTANGVAELDENGLILASQLPSYVDDVVEGYLNEGSFYEDSEYATAITGESGKIYLDLTSSKTYRWSGTTYAEISPSIALGETSSTAYRGDRGKIAYDHSQLTSGNPHNVTKTDIGLGNVENKTSETIRSEITKSNVTTALGYIPPETDTTYEVVTDTTDGLMSSELLADLNSKPGWKVDENGNETFNYQHNTSTGGYAHAEGKGTKATGECSHSEGSGTRASAAYAHAEGSGATASGNQAHAEGGGTTASGDASHAEGSVTKASGSSAHAEGVWTEASATAAHAEGYWTIASSNYQHAGGKYNVEDADDKFAFIIGNGTANDERSNAFAVDWDGSIYVNNSETGVNLNTIQTTVNNLDSAMSISGGATTETNQYIRIDDTASTPIIYTLAEGTGITDTAGNTVQELLVLGKNLANPATQTNISYQCTVTYDSTAESFTMTTDGTSYRGWSMNVGHWLGESYNLQQVKNSYMVPGTYTTSFNVDELSINSETAMCNLVVSYYTDIGKFISHRVIRLTETGPFSITHTAPTGTKYFGIRVSMDDTNTESTAVNSITWSNMQTEAGDKVTDFVSYVAPQTYYVLSNDHTSTFMDASGAAIGSGLPHDTTTVMINAGGTTSTTTNLTMSAIHDDSAIFLALKSTGGMTVQADGDEIGTYNGVDATTVNITPENINAARLENLSKMITVYIDATNGTDANTGTATSSRVQTLARALEIIKGYGVARMYFYNGEYSFPTTLHYFYNQTVIIARAASTETDITIYGGLGIYGGSVNVSYVTLDLSTDHAPSTNGIGVRYGGAFAMSNGTIKLGTPNYGIYSYQASRVSLRAVTFDGTCANRYLCVGEGSEAMMYSCTNNTGTTAIAAGCARLYISSSANCTYTTSGGGVVWDGLSWHADNQASGGST